MNEEKGFPKTLVEAVKYFADPEVAHNFVASMRWPDGKVICPRCGSSRVAFTAKRRVWTCSACAPRKQFSVKVGTIMEDSPIPLDKWLVGMWLIMSAKNGISSYELHRALGITQKSAWYLGHRIRLSLHRGSVEKMSGICESDETYIGAKARYMHKDRRTGVGDAGIKKTAIQGILERAKGKKHSRVVLKVVPNTRRPELCGNVREYVLGGSTVCTDALMSYDDLECDYDRQVVNHLECYARGNVHTNGLENFWSLFKRSLKGTYVNVEPFHLFRYCDEQAFRFNERKSTDSERFLEAVPSIVGRRLTYKGLTGSVEVTGTPECHANIEDDASQRGVRMPEITIPEGAYPAIQKLTHLGAEEFSAFLNALARAKPAATPSLFEQHVAEHAPHINSSTIKMIVSELFSMNYAFEDEDSSASEMAQSIAEAAFNEQSEEFPVNESDREILKDRLAKLFELKASLGLTSKAVGLLTDAAHLFYTARILTDVRPIFNKEGDAVAATVILHNLVLHYGESGAHKDFVITLDTDDIEVLRDALDRADRKANALRALMKRSEISYLDMEE